MPDAAQSLDDMPDDEQSADLSAEDEFSDVISSDNDELVASPGGLSEGSNWDYYQVRNTGCYYLESSWYTHKYLLKAMVDSCSLFFPLILNVQLWF